MKRMTWDQLTPDQQFFLLTSLEQANEACRETVRSLEQSGVFCRACGIRVPTLTQNWQCPCGGGSISDNRPW